MNNKKFSNITLNYLISNFSPRLASLILLPVFLRLMEINIWGEISLLLAFQIVFVNIFSWGLDSLGHRIFQDLDSNKKSEFIKRTTKKFFIYNLFFLIILEFILNTNLTNFFKIDYGVPFRLAVFTGILISYARLLTNLYKSLNESKIIRNSIYIESLLIPIFQLLLVVIIIYFYGFEDRMIVSSYFIGQFFGTLIKTLYLKRNTDILFSSFHEKTLNISKKMQENYSNLSYIYAIFAMLLAWQDRFILSRLYTLEEVAEYSTVYRLADLHGVFVGAFVSAIAPILWSVNNKNKNKSLELFKSIISISSLLACLGVCISVIIGPILLPPKYQSALAIIPYLSIGFIFSSYASLYGLLLEKKYKLNIRLASMIFGALINFLLIYITIDELGIIGLAVSTMVGYFVVFLINYVYAEKEYKYFLFNKELLFSISIITVFIILYRDVWFLNLFFLVLSVLILSLMLNQFKKLLHIQKDDFFNIGDAND